MTDSTDNVLELLESIDSGIGEKHTTKDGEKRVRKPRKPRTDDTDIIGFLDEIRKDTELSSTSSKQVPATIAARAAAPPAKVPFTEAGTTRPTTQQAAVATAATTATAGGAAGAGGVAGATDSAETAAAAPEAAVSEPLLGQLPEISALTNWWSSNKTGLWNSATSVASQAANRAQDAIRQAEEQIKHLQHEVIEGGAGEGGESKFNINALQNRFTSVLNSIVPPIQKHEQLNIHIFHDMVGYSNIDQIVHAIFERIMEQVEGGGDLNLIVQCGKERHRTAAEYAPQRQLNALRGSAPQAGEKLAKASVDEFHHAQAAKKEGEGAKAGSDTKSYVDVSEIFVSIQPVVTPARQGICSQLENAKDSDFIFVIYLADFQHDIQLSVCSQAFPSEWADWLDAPDSTYENSVADPRIWALEWVEDGLGLAVGTLAQKYVTIRMGLSNESVDTPPIPMP